MKPVQTNKYPTILVHSLSLVVTATLIYTFFTLGLPRKVVDFNEGELDLMVKMPIKDKGKQRLIYTHPESSLQAALRYGHTTAYSHFIHFNFQNQTNGTRCNNSMPLTVLLLLWRSSVTTLRRPP